MANVAPTSFWKFPVIPSVWEDITDIDNWLPAMPSYGALNGLSISEDEQQVYVEAAIPGVDPKDVDITFHKGVLWIKGQTKEEEKEKKYYRKATESFSYRIVIPEQVNQSAEPQAEYTKGIMKVTFQKSPETQPKKIAVNAA